MAQVTPKGPIPKGKIVALQGSGSAWQIEMPFDDRLDSIILYNLAGVTINVSFEGSALSVPLAASASLNLDTWDLAATEIYKIDFTGSASASVNMVWVEGQGIGYIWLKVLRMWLGQGFNPQGKSLRQMLGMGQ